MDGERHNHQWPNETSGTCSGRQVSKRLEGCTVDKGVVTDAVLFLISIFLMGEKKVYVASVQ